MIHLVIGQGRYVRQVKVPFWTLALVGGAAALAVFLLLTFLASIALFAIPAVLIGAVAARLLGGRSNSSREPIFTHNRRPDSNVIDGEYRVLREDDRR
jgi:hypothetical protein